MAFALYIKTESGDDYVFAFDGEPSDKEIIKGIQEKLGEEFDYICDYKSDSSYPRKKQFKLK